MAAWKAECLNEWCDGWSKFFFDDPPPDIVQCPRCGWPATRSLGITQVADDDED